MVKKEEKKGHGRKSKSLQGQELLFSHLQNRPGSSMVDAWEYGN